MYFSTQRELGIFSVTFAKVIKISQTQNILKRKIFLIGKEICRSQKNDVTLHPEIVYLT